MTQSHSQRVTRSDVAKEAGTSVAVVSYVINNGPRPVAEATRQRVLQAIKKTGYRPNGIARALASGSTQHTGLWPTGYLKPVYCLHGARPAAPSVLLTVRCSCWGMREITADESVN